MRSPPLRTRVRRPASSKCSSPGREATAAGAAQQSTCRAPCAARRGQCIPTVIHCARTPLALHAPPWELGSAGWRPFRSDAAAADARPRRLPRRASIIQECCRRADAQRFYLRPRAPAQPCAWRLEPRPTLGEQASRASLSLPVAFTPQGRARVRCCTNRARIGTNRRASTLVAPACARV